MARLLFDIETDGLDDASVVHTIVIKNIDTGIRTSYVDQPGYHNIVLGLKVLEDADVLIGHNILDYDLPTLRKIYPEFATKAVIRDTLIMSRLIWTDLENEDFRRRDRGTVFPPTLIGSHSLKAWGYRLGILKGMFAETTDWKTWTRQMQEYCEQDVEVTHALLKLIEAQKYSEAAIELEHDFRHIIHQQERHGFRFDEKAAGCLAADLLARREQITTELRKVVPPKSEVMKTPAFYEWVNPFDGTRFQAETKGKLRDLLKEKNGSRKSDSFITPGPMKVRETPFNPGSRDQVAAHLMSQGWVPTKFTETGKPQVDESTLDGIDTPAAKLLSEYFVTSKLIGQLSEGDNAWLKLARKGRIHGQVNTNGAVTGRCAHFKPNIGQVPAVVVGKDKQVLLGYAGRFGWECRSLFVADEGQVLVGADASGLELRCLAHYMARYDGGEYGKIVLDGDVHTVNQQAAGIDTRAHAKTFIYSYLYGAGNHLIGVNCGGVKPEQVNEYKAHHQEWASELKAFNRKKRKAPDFKFTDVDVATAVKGLLIRRKFEKQTPALALLKDTISQAVADRGYLVGLDGRRLHVRYDHAALNTLLQAAGALAVKQATIILYKSLIAKGWVFGRDWSQVAHIHDEIQSSVRPELAQEYGQTAVQSIREAGEHFQFRVRLDGEFKIGPSWASTH